MSPAKQDLLNKAWGLAYRVARKPSPPGTVALPEALVKDELTRGFEEFLDQFESLPPESEFLAAVSTWARQRALDRIAHEREQSNDLEHYRQGGAHQANLDLRKLRPPPESMDQAEWSALNGVLQPCGFAVLKPFTELGNEDKQEVFSKSLTDLYKPRQRDGLSPLDQIRVFEEVFPFFSRIVHLNAKGRLRSRAPVVDAPVDENAMHSGFQPGVTFSEIVFECREALTEIEWDLIVRKFLAGETDTEMIDNVSLLAALKIKPGLSAISRRRYLKEHLTGAVEKLAQCLKQTGHTL